MGWTHRVLREKAEPFYNKWEYSICEDFGELGHTGSKLPVGDSLESLRSVLEKMIKAVDRAIKNPDLILCGDSGPFDNQLTSE